MRLVENAYGSLEIPVLSVVGGQHSELDSLRGRAEETALARVTRCVSCEVGLYTYHGWASIWHCYIDCSADSSISDLLCL